MHATLSRAVGRPESLLKIFSGRKFSTAEHQFTLDDRERFNPINLRCVY